MDKIHEKVFKDCYDYPVHRLKIPIYNIQQTPHSQAYTQASKQQIDSLAKKCRSVSVFKTFLVLSTRFLRWTSFRQGLSSSQLVWKPPGRRKTMKRVERSLIWWCKNVSASSSCLSVYSSLSDDGSSPMVRYKKEV